MSLPDGWLDPPEVIELQLLARDKVVLELGAWKGRSTVCMAEVAGYVVSVDRHHGIPEWGDGEDSLPDYLKAVRPLGNVAIVVANFNDFVPLLGEFEFDLAYVDGDHDEASVARDSLLAVEHIKLGGTVAFHDWDFESVRAGAVPAVGRRSPDRVVGSLASFRIA